MSLPGSGAGWTCRWAVEDWMATARSENIPENISIMMYFVIYQGEVKGNVEYPGVQNRTIAVVGRVQDFISRTKDGRPDKAFTAKEILLKTQLDRITDRIRSHTAVCTGLPAIMIMSEVIL